MSNDIRSILERLTVLEGQTTPVSVKHGLNKQQKSVPQLPALLKATPIKALGSKTDPKHPFAGYMVGDSVEPKKTALEETMGEIEEDMLDKVKHDLTHYLDMLEKKVRVDRDLKDKAVDAVEKGQVEEEDPEECHAPVKTYDMEDGSCLECYGNDNDGYEVRHNGRSLPTKFPKLDHADMAVKLFQKRRSTQEPEQSQDLSQDYIEER